MYKSLFIALFMYFSNLIASARVSYSELYNERGVWYSIHTNSSFNGTAYKLSNDSNVVIQQTNYIDGLEWGKYYEWWPDGTKKVDGTYRSG